MICLRDLKLIFKICHRTQAANDDRGLYFAGKIHQQPVKGYNMDILQIGGHLL